MDRLNVATGTKWEPIVGYSRAVRVGNQIFVSGTTATDERGEVVGPGDAYVQTQQALANIEVKRLIAPELLVEIEADAISSEHNS